MAEMIIFLVLAIVAFTISIRSFMEKGFLFNNAYLFASEQERKTMDKKPHYRQSAIVFCLLGITLLLFAIESIVKTEWLLYVSTIFIIAAIVYAIASGRSG